MSRGYQGTRIVKREGKATRDSIRLACKVERARLVEDARARREALRDALRGEREALKGSCSVKLADARAATDRAIAEARKSAVHVDRLRKAARSPAQQHAAERARMALATRIAESDDEVRRSVADSELRRVWDRVKHLPRLRKLNVGRASRLERFLEWAHDNSAAVSRILAELDRPLAREETEREYRERQANERASSRARHPKQTVRVRATGQPYRVEVIDLSDVPF